MRRLLVRFTLFCLVFTLLGVWLVLHEQRRIDIQTRCQNIQTMQPIIRLTDNWLAQYPIVQWPAELNKLQLAPRAVYLVPSSSLSLSSNQFHELYQHQYVCTTETDGGLDVVSYKATSSSKWVYKIYNGIGNADTARFKIGLAQAVIIRHLKHLPPQQWQHYIQIMNQHFMHGKLMRTAQFDQQPLISLKKLTQVHLSTAKKDWLKQYGWAVGFPTGSRDVNTAYAMVKGTDYVVQYGPYQVNFHNAYANDLLFLYILISFELIVIGVAVMFGRSLRKLNRLANDYGRGDFDSRQTVSSWSILQPLNQQLIDMGRRIQVLIQSQKDLSNAVAHELRTPMSRLRFSLQLLKDAKDVKQIELRVATMQQDIDELDDLIAEVMSYAQLDRITLSLNKTICSLTDELTDLVDKIKTSSNKEMLLFYQAPLTIQADEKLLRRMLQNIIGNAEKFAASLVKITVTADAQRTMLVIEDNGPGIDPADIDVIFQPFKQLDNQAHSNKTGYGLGLAIVKKIVDLHGWHLRVESSELGGARFVMRF